MTDKISKRAAEYTEKGTPEEHCAICKYYLRRGACEKVLGPVVRGGWCRLFERK